MQRLGQRQGTLVGDLLGQSGNLVWPVVSPCEHHLDGARFDTSALQQHYEGTPSPPALPMMPCPVTFSTLFRRICLSQYDGTGPFAATFKRDLQHLTRQLQNVCKAHTELGARPSPSTVRR